MACSRATVSCRSEEHTSELQSRPHLVCRLLLEKKKHQRCTGAWARLILLAASRSGIAKASRASRNESASARTIRIFFFNDTATTEIYTLSLHDALPISTVSCTKRCTHCSSRPRWCGSIGTTSATRSEEHTSELSHVRISYAVFCLKKKKKNIQINILKKKKKKKKKIKKKT